MERGSALITACSLALRYPKVLGRKGLCGWIMGWGTPVVGVERLLSSLLLRLQEQKESQVPP